MSEHEIQVIKDEESGLHYRLRCSCGFMPADDDELAAHIAAASFTVVVGGAPRPELRDALLQAARAWAHADRTADDRAAMIHRIERQITKSDPEVTPELKAQREAASIALRAACQAEGDADEKLHELARLILNDCEQTS